MTNYKITDLPKLAAPTHDVLLSVVNDPSGTPVSTQLPILRTAIGAIVPGGRLTLVSGDAVSDAASQTTIYYTPYTHNMVKLYNTTNNSWELHIFSEVSLSVPSTTNTNYDVFLYNNSGTLTLEAVAWSDSSAGASARATAITRQNGVPVKSGDASRLFLGTFRTTGTSGQVTDNAYYRFLWNYYNRFPTTVHCVSNSTHSYSTESYRAWNNQSLTGATVIELVNGGFDGERVHATGLIMAYASKHISALSLNSDSSANTHIVNAGAYNSNGYYGSPSTPIRVDFPIGYNYLQVIEYGFSGGIASYLQVILPVEK